MTKINCFNIVFLAVFFTKISYADVHIKSLNEGVLTFSQEKKGEHYDNNSWGKITFSNHDFSADLSRSDRYYIEDGSSKLSPSGKYLIVTSVSEGYLEYGDGTKKYTEKAYCSVVDMNNGCIVSDWDGEACGYTWVGNKDVLASSENTNANRFDFESMRPMINKITDNLYGIDNSELANIIRCDSPSKENINNYQQLVNNNQNVRGVILQPISNYLNNIAIESVVKVKSELFTSPDDNNKTKAYLVTGDKVKVIQNSSDKKWLNVGYINSKGVPLVAWIKADTVAK